MPETPLYENAPKPTFDNIMNFYKNPTELYAPEWWRTFIAGKPKGKDDYAVLNRQPWATKSFQALVYAGLLATLGYGGRKFLRGAAPETQEALAAIDKYVPQGENPAETDNSRLVDKDKYVSTKDRAKNALKRVFSMKNGTDSFNSLSYALPPAAAVMAWMIGQKLAEKEIEGTDLSDSKARLAKARADYNRVLAKKLNPKARIPEQVIQDRLQNPIDYAIDKGIEMKDKAISGIKENLFSGKQAYEPGPLKLQPDNKVYMDELRQKYGDRPGVLGFLKVLSDMSGFTPILVGLGLAASLGGGMYGWNNQRKTDKNIQKALDKEAAVKRRALEMNDQRLDVDKLFGQPVKPATAL